MWVVPGIGGITVRYRRALVSGNSTVPRLNSAVLSTTVRSGVDHWDAGLSTGVFSSGIAYVGGLCAGR